MEAFTIELVAPVVDAMPMTESSAPCQRARREVAEVRPGVRRSPQRRDSVCLAGPKRTVAVRRKILDGLLGVIDLIESFAACKSATAAWAHFEKQRAQRSAEHLLGDLKVAARQWRVRARSVEEGDDDAPPVQWPDCRQLALALKARQCLLEDGSVDGDALRDLCTALFQPRLSHCSTKELHALRDGFRQLRVDHPLALKCVSNGDKAVAIDGLLRDQIDRLVKQEIRLRGGAYFFEGLERHAEEGGPASTFFRQCAGVGQAQTRQDRPTPSLYDQYLHSTHVLNMLRNLDALWASRVEGAQLEEDAHDLLLPHAGTLGGAKAINLMRELAVWRRGLLDEKTLLAGLVLADREAVESGKPILFGANQQFWPNNAVLRNNLAMLRPDKLARIVSILDQTLAVLYRVGGERILQAQTPYEGEPGAPEVAFERACFGLRNALARIDDAQLRASLATLPHADLRRLDRATMAHPDIPGNRQIQAAIKQLHNARKMAGAQDLVSRQAELSEAAYTHDASGITRSLLGLGVAVAEHQGYLAQWGQTASDIDIACGLKASLTAAGWIPSVGGARASVAAKAAFLGYLRNLTVNELHGLQQARQQLAAHGFDFGEEDLDAEMRLRVGELHKTLQDEFKHALEAFAALGVDTAAASGKDAAFATALAGVAIAGQEYLATRVEFGERLGVEDRQKLIQALFPPIDRQRKQQLASVCQAELPRAEKRWFTMLEQAQKLHDDSEAHQTRLSWEQKAHRARFELDVLEHVLGESVR